MDGQGGRVIREWVELADGVVEREGELGEDTVGAENAQPNRWVEVVAEVPDFEIRFDREPIIEHELAVHARRIGDSC